MLARASCLTAGSQTKASPPFNQRQAADYGRAAVVHVDVSSARRSDDVYLSKHRCSRPQTCPERGSG